MKAWLSQHHVEYIDRDLLANPPSVSDLLAMAASLPEGMMSLVHREKTIDGRLASEVLQGTSDQGLAERLHREPDLLKKPILYDGRQIIAGKQMDALEKVFSPVH